MFLICGEALMDMIPMPMASGSNGYVPHPGGSPYNVAMALGRQGAHVRFLNRFSGDFFGKELKQHLLRSKVNLDLCPETPELTTLGFVDFRSDPTQPDYAFYTRGTAGCGLTVEELPDPIPNEVECVHFGSFSLAVEPFGSTLETLLEQIKSSKTVSLDPNIRPFLVNDRNRFLGRLNRFLSAAHLIKLSDEDLSWMNPDSGPERFAQDHIEKGASMVVLTQGAHGARAWTHSGKSQIQAPKVQVADTVGAGDTFHANLLHFISVKHGLDPSVFSKLNDQELEEMLLHAAKAAALNCAQKGCNPPWRKELW